MQTYLGLIFILHLLLIAFLVGKIKGGLRGGPLLATAAYFFGFYLVIGILFSRDPNWFAPEASLINDYYWKKPEDRSRYFQDLPRPENETPDEDDDERDGDLERRDEEGEARDPEPTDRLDPGIPLR